MKAAVRSGYGSPVLLNVREVERSIRNDNEVLVCVHAATVNKTDCHVLSGRPLVMRLFTGFAQQDIALVQPEDRSEGRFGGFIRRC